MPRVRRRPKRRRIGYTKGQVEHLLSGYQSCGDDFGREVRGTLDVEAMREAWITLRDELLPQWIAENPGTRPYAWWQFDAPERRQRIGTRRYLYPLAEIDHTTPEPHYEFIADDKPHPFDNPSVPSESHLSSTFENINKLPLISEWPRLSLSSRTGIYGYQTHAGG